ncbi:hypothetical protein [Haloferula sp. BvORR071]|uniref:hypothetical protein n=1 Tax=Haloferula sp. BvORR071 TaxID=1396141 RepID=UPI002240EF4F|nr:hypothetical protein [Haloferula sp. BvORR071]
MRFGLQRSLIFWSGLLAVVFLCWAWKDSRERRTYVQVAGFLLASDQGGLVLERNPYLFRDFEAGREPALVLRRTMKGPFLLHGKGELVNDGLVDPEWDYRELCENTMSYQPQGNWLLFIPYWLLLMVAGLAWWVLLLWRLRRRIDWGQEK